MEEVSVIGIDLAKRSFQVHGAKADGSVVFRRKLSRGKVLSFLASQPPCTVAMEACAGAHYWGREIAALGHEVRLVPPIYVKPFVKRQKLCAIQHNLLYVAARIMWRSARTVPWKHEKSPCLRNIIFFTQSAARKAISPLLAFHGRSGPGPAASQSAIAFAFISISISA